MTNYENDIMNLLDGETPKQKYESLKNLMSNNSHLIGKVEYYHTVFDSLRETRNDATIGNLKLLLPSR